MTTIESILTRLTNAVSGTDKELYTEEELTKFATFLSRQVGREHERGRNCRVIH